jgi:hypothetical protein
MAEEIGLPIRKLLENNTFYLIMGQTKTRKLLLTELKTKMLTYSDTTSYNSSLDGNDSAISLSTLPAKNSFLFFLCL